MRFDRSKANNSFVKNKGRLPLQCCIFAPLTFTPFIFLYSILHIFKSLRYTLIQILNLLAKIRIQLELGNISVGHHGIYIKWYFINRRARTEKSLLFDLYKAFV